jgi:hypothetical protein
MASKFAASFLPDLLSDPEDGGDRFFESSINFHQTIQRYTADDDTTATAVRTSNPI